jgi:predicted site-specific integrase-resolvase
MDVTMCRMTGKTYSTLEAAEKAEIHRATLIRWLKEGRVKASTETPMAGGNVLRVWTEADIEKLIKYRKKNYRVPNEIRDKK